MRVGGPLLGDHDRRRLLGWARGVIEAAVGGGQPPTIDPAALADDLRGPRGAFVTITMNGELRGCMGSIDFERPLWQNVIGAAVASAVRDPRFPPVQEGELAAIRLEISVLDPPQELPDPALFDPAVHGIVVEKNGHRALLLPRVAQEHGWGAETTLQAVCLKAGLPPDAWRDPGARLMVFAAFDFGEA